MAIDDRLARDFGVATLVGVEKRGSTEPEEKEGENENA